MLRSRELTTKQTKEKVSALRKAGLTFTLIVRGSVETKDDKTVWQAEGWRVEWPSLRSLPVAIIDGERVPFSPKDAARFTISIEGWV